MTTNDQPLLRPKDPSGFGLGFIALCLFGYILHAGAAILIPFVIAVFVWYLINTLARFLTRVEVRHTELPRFVRVFMSMTVLVGAVWFGYKLIGANAAAILEAAPVYQKKFQIILSDVLLVFPEQYRPDPRDFNVGAYMTVLVKTFTGIAGKTLVVLFYTGFLLYEQRFFARKLHEITTSDTAEARVHNVLSNIDDKVQRYIAVKVIVSLMTGVSTWLLLMFFHVDFAAFWGVMAFVLNFIPYVGSIAAVVLPSVIALVQDGDPVSVTAVVLGLSLLQIFWAHVMEPRYLGDSLNLSPICIILALAFWGLIWGVPGMFLSVPILSMMVIIMSQFDSTRAFAVLLSRTGDVDHAPAPKQKRKR
jgi:predicted PurR-regulated permease PerM